MRVPEKVHSVYFQQAQAQRKPDLDAENNADTAGAATACHLVTILKPKLAYAGCKQQTVPERETSSDVVAFSFQLHS